LANRLIGETVDNEKTLLFRLDEASRPEYLEVLRGIGSGYSCLLSEDFYRSLALAEKVEMLQPFGTPHGLSDSRELFIDCVFEKSVGVLHWKQTQVF
jgi:hypothetical protein